MIVDPVIHMIASLILSYVFVIAGFHKCQAPEEFTTTLINYKILPAILVRQGVYLFPTVEIMTGVALLIPPIARLAALSAGFLLLIYMLAIGVNLLRGHRHLDCGCGGPAQRQTISEWMLVRNGVLLSLAYMVTCQIDPRSLLWLDGIVIVLATLMACLFYNMVNQLLANRDLLKVLRGRHA